mmetsp:Transcript_41845/g.99607  ORF Transcript_41845/g.99607 Transcript_41845/m.99607 type:complete len:251 (+) Transcript_41845:125-877(+)
MRPAPVDDVRGLHAVIDRAQAAGDFGNHAAGHHALVNKPLGAALIYLGDQRVSVLDITEDAGHVRHQHELLSIQRSCDGRCRNIRVHVQEVALCIRSHCGNNGYQPFIQSCFEHILLDACDLSHEAELFVVHLLGLKQATVDAAEPNGGDARGAHGGDNALVHLAHEDHGNDLHGVRIGDTQAAHELGLDAHLGQPAVDLGAAPMHQHRLQAQGPQQRHVPDGALRAFDHRGATVLDHHHGAPEPRQCRQ